MFFGEGGTAGTVMEKSTFYREGMVGVSLTGDIRMRSFVSQGARRVGPTFNADKVGRQCCLSFGEVGLFGCTRFRQLFFVSSQHRAVGCTTGAMFPPLSYDAHSFPPPSFVSIW